MDLGKFCIDKVEIFPVTTLYFLCRNVKFSQHTHGETWKRFSDGEREAWEAAAILFYPLLLYSIHTRCSFPYFHGVSKYYRVHESCLDCGAAMLSSCEWDSAEPARASLFWVIFFKNMNLAVWLTLNIAWNWSHKMWNWIQYSFLYCNTNTSNR